MSSIRDIRDNLYRYPGPSAKVCRNIFDLVALVAIIPPDEIEEVVKHLLEPDERSIVDHADRQLYVDIGRALQVYTENIRTEWEELDIPRQLTSLDKEDK